LDQPIGRRMSRAFVKEPEGEAAEEDLPLRGPSPYPNYVTPRGFSLLKARLQELEEERGRLGSPDADLSAKTRIKQVKRDIRSLQESLERAIVVDPGLQSRDDVRFGAAVTVMDENQETHEFTIVGEGEACAPKGLISWVSPLAKALLGRRVGDTVIWERPAGNLELEIVSFHYPGD
jgi:transcription elongation GreA/GreB family factor